MPVRVTLALAAALTTLAVAGPAHATVGALSFSSCVQASAIAAPPCAGSAQIDHPTGLVSNAGLFGTEAGVHVTNAASGSLALFSDTPPLAFATCATHPLQAGCSVDPGPAIGAPQAVAADADFGPFYISGDANDAISIVQGVGASCAAEGGALGCGGARGLHGPRHLVLAGQQLYVATRDGIAWFDIVFVPDSAVRILAFAGCMAAGGADGCTPSSVSNETAIAVSPDRTSVYVGSSDGSIAGFRRGADGGLTQVSCITAADPAPAGCVTGHGLMRVSDLAISADGTSLYAAATDSHAIATFRRASDGTLAETGCLARTAADGCDIDAALSTVDSVVVSPDGDNVYAGNTHSDVAVFDRTPGGTLTPAGCVGSAGGVCGSSPLIASYAGAIAVSGDGRWVHVVGEDGNDLTADARTPRTADVSLTAATAPLGAGGAALTITDDNHGPDTADDVSLTVRGLAGGVSVSGVFASSGNCTVANGSDDPSHDAPITPTVTCQFGALAAGASVTVRIVMRSTAGGAAGFYAVSDAALYMLDPTPLDASLRPVVTFPANGPTPGPVPKLSITKLGVSPRTFAVGRRGGTRLRFTVSDAASARVTIASVRIGHRVHGACRSSVHRGPLCTRTSVRGALTARVAKGTNTIAFSGRLHGRALAAGRYTATVRATAAGQTAATPRTVHFTIAPR